MKKLFQNRIALAAIFFTIGAVSVSAVTQYRDAKNPNGYFDEFFENFNNWYQNKFGITEIKQTEDDRFLYYEIDLKGVAAKSIQIEVEEGQVYIFAESQVKDDHSKLIRAFQLPLDVDADNFKRENQEKKIVLIFPKIKIS